ncbi:MAG: hypothetical protein AB7S78_05935 [Candidatus Omnitrophota bacterium]
MEYLKRFTIVIAVVLTGCAKLGHMPQLITLKKLSDDQTVTDQYVDGQEERFKRMRQEMDAGSFGRYTDKNQILAEFGEPVFIKVPEQGSGNAEMWMYRRPVNYSDSDKVFIYFDGKGQLLSYKLERFKG